MAKRTNLSAETVAVMRKMTRETGVYNSAHWMKELGISYCAVVSAINGKTYRDLPDAVPQSEIQKVPGKGGNTYNLDESVILDLVALRKDDPATWSFRKLANKVNNTFGTRYEPIGIKRMLDKHWHMVPDPENPKSVYTKPVAAKPRRRAAKAKAKAVAQEIIMGVAVTNTDEAHTEPQKFYNGIPYSPNFGKPTQPKEMGEAPLPRGRRVPVRKANNGPDVSSRFERDEIDPDEKVKVRYKREKFFGMKVIDISTPVGRKLLARRILVDRARDAAYNDHQELRF